MFSFFLGLLAGLLGDVLRSILAPSTTEFIAKKLAILLPGLERKANEEANLRMLDAIQKAKSAGVDPSNVHFLDSKPQIFLKRIGYSREAFLEAEFLSPQTANMTQADLTEQAYERAHNAEILLDELVRQIENHPGMTKRRLRDFDSAQRAWWTFHRNMVIHAKRAWEGGSGENMIGHLESEALILERVGHMKQILHELPSIQQ